MFAIHREYELKNQQDCHAHIQVNPTGNLEFEILESHEHHNTDFNHLSFEFEEGNIKVLGQDQDGKHCDWQLLLAEKDAKELNHLVVLATEQYETLMRDLF
tara:strand:- start:640 stop:942 length:303 start_codon:yes stop_codon:yes gene_type:complete